MDKGLKNTTYYKKQAENSSDTQEFIDNVYNELQSQKDIWKQKFNEILAETGCNKTELAELCNTSRMTINNWKNGALPQSRDKFLMLGMLAGYDKGKINELLSKYGRYPELYSKTLEDCICIYVTDHNYGSDTYAVYKDILNRVKTIISDNNMEGKNIDTDVFDGKLSQIGGEEELEKFIRENVAAFSSAYHRFYVLVMRRLREKFSLTDDSSNVTQLSASQDGWSSSLKQCVYEIKKKSWYPTRNKIISLGMHMNMNCDEIDELLKAAHMSPLYSKNVFESAIIYAVNAAMLAQKYDSNNNVIESEPDERLNIERDILCEFDIPELNDFVTEIMEHMNDE